MLTFYIDDFTPCLIDDTTGEIVETEVIRITRASFLSKYNRHTGWYTDWSDELKDNEVYALVIKGTVDIQGLVSVRLDDISQETFISWGCVNPESNKVIKDSIKYRGIGGHLMAIASDKSLDYGRDGSFYGFAANEKLLNHYVEKYGAIPVWILHENHVVFDSKAAEVIRKEYDYEWTDEEI